MWTFIVNSIKSFNLVKFFGAFNIFSTAMMAKWVLWILAGMAGAWIFWSAFVKPTYHTENDVRIETVQTYYAVPQNRPFYGLNLLGIKIGWEGK